MKNILAEIVEKKKEIVAAAKKALPFDEVKRQARPGGFRLSHRVRGEAWSLIAECKLQSPAKGRLCRAYSVTELAKIYEENGASALSVHTDPHFLGSNEESGMGDARAFIREQPLPAASLVPDASFLVFLDCTALGFKTQGELEHFFAFDAKVGMNSGAMFGKGGVGFMRLNVGSPRSVVNEALDRMINAIRAK